MEHPPIISESDFVELWGAHVHPSGDLLQHEDVVNQPLHQVWTIVETDEDHWIAMPGFHVVNRIGYCLTTKPWEDGTPDAFWFENDLDDGDDNDNDNAEE